MSNAVLFNDVQDSLEFLKFARPLLLKVDAEAEKVLEGRDQVLDRFGPLFRDHADQLTESDVSDFLDFEKNCHWTGLHRQKPNILHDLDAVRHAVANLVKRKELNDDVAARFDAAEKSVKGFGAGIISPILYVAFPDYYGVWNSKSEFGLKLLNLWPMASRGESHGTVYGHVNNSLFHVRRMLNSDVLPGEPMVDLWTVDYYWHALKLLAQRDQLDAVVSEYREKNPIPQD